MSSSNTYENNNDDDKNGTSQDNDDAERVKDLKFWFSNFNYEKTEAEIKKTFPLHCAVMGGTVEDIVELRRRGRDINGLISREYYDTNEGNVTPLLLALDYARYEAAICLMSFDEVNVNIPDRMGYTPMYYAVQHRYGCCHKVETCIEMLRERGAEVNSLFLQDPLEYRGKIPLYWPRFFQGNWRIDVGLEIILRHAGRPKRRHVLLKFAKRVNWCLLPITPLPRGIVIQHIYKYWRHDSWIK